MGRSEVVKPLDGRSVVSMKHFTNFIYVRNIGLTKRIYGLKRDDAGLSPDVVSIGGRRSARTMNNYRIRSNAPTSDRSSRRTHVRSQASQLQASNTHVQ